MSLTVKQLIEKLKKENPDALVVVSHDSEGNSFSPLHQAEPSTYKADRNQWHGYLTESAPSEADGTVAAVVLWPSN